MKFVEGDLLSDSWNTDLPRKVYDGVLCFAAMHHIPAYERRLKLLRMVRHSMRKGGLFIHSNWQFHRSPRLLSRVQPWSLMGI